MIAVYLENGRVSLRRRPRPRRPAGFALIRLLCAGICDTDLELQRGYYSFRGTPGHEFVGEVVSADNPKLPGRRVAGEINLPCGACEWCRRGLGRHCPGRKVLGILGQPGVFAEYFVLPEKNLHLVPESIPTEHAVFIEPLAAACEILDQVQIRRGASVAVLGDGKLGLLAAQVLHLHGADVSLFGHHAKKLEIAKGAGVKVQISREEAPAAAYDWVVEATGSAQGLKEAINMTRPRGTVVIKSTVHGSVAIDTAQAVVNEISLVGSRCGRFEPALRLLRTGKIQVAEMIHARVPLAEAPRAFELAAAKGALKVLMF
jgi:alcohol dehydrogenase